MKILMVQDIQKRNTVTNILKNQEYDMKTNLKLALCLLVAAVIGAESAKACNSCSLMNVSKLESVSDGDFSFYLSERYTSYNKAEDLSYKQQRDSEYVKDYSNAQVGISYGVADSFALQAYLPVINRRSESVEALRVSEDSDFGVGDAVLAGSYDLINYQEDSLLLNTSMLAGIKLPTGETGTLNRVVGKEETMTRHHAVGHGMGGRTLVLGSGSYDFIFGLGTMAVYDRYILTGTAQYTARTEGDFDYRFADELLWSAGTGYYLLLDPDFSLGLMAMLSSEYKSKDKIDGALIDGSQYSNLFAGPSVLMTFGKKLSTEIGFDFRVTDEDLASVVVPEWRLKADISYRFS